MDAGQRTSGSSGGLGFHSDRSFYYYVLRTHVANPPLAQSLRRNFNAANNPNNPDTRRDTAQAVTHGVNFRFDDVRTVVHRVGGKIDKPVCLCRNYRSHSGILNYANTFLKFLEKAFPHGTNKLEPDSGIARPTTCAEQLWVSEQCSTQPSRLSGPSLN